MTCQEIGVEMRQDDMTDFEPVRDRILEILLDVALRVDYNRGVRLSVADQVGRMGQAAQIVLFQQHVL
jgi:hypothetical protein